LLFLLTIVFQTGHNANFDAVSSKRDNFDAVR